VIAFALSAVVSFIAEDIRKVVIRIATMTEFYPGSSKRRRNYEDQAGKAEDENSLEDFDLGKSKTYLLNNQRVELYPLGSLAAALNRAPVTIRKLEKEGIIPKATMILPSHDERGTRRLYTREQIAGLRKAAEEEGVLCPSPNGKWRAIEETNFREKALSVFKENK